MDEHLRTLLRLDPALSCTTTVGGPTHIAPYVSALVLRPPQPGDMGWIVHRQAVLRIAAVVVATIPAAGVAQPSSVLPAGATMEQADYEDYRRGIGRLEGGVLRATLEARAAAWSPWGKDGAALRTHVFAADGETPRTPGPLIRVTAGTPVQLTVKNSLPHTLVMRGLRDRGAIPASAPPFTAIVTDSLTIAPGETAEVRFTPTEPGTFLYNGRARVPGESPAPTPFPGRPTDRALWGVLLVDPPGGPPATTPEERIFLITHWADRELPGTFLPATRFFINGRSWPPTERLEYAQGDTVRWRVINVTGRNHPMHLHGAYFTVDARGDQLRDVVFPAAERRLRFMHISPDDDKQVSLVAGDSVQQWRIVAKDGADLPPSQVRTLPARLRINVGETFDYLWTPEPGEFVLQVVTTFDQGVAAFQRRAPQPHTATVPITVR
ncbi:hypothetical protein BH23GEM1_BH23GEM1_10270 [soil metagenome]